MRAVAWLTLVALWGCAVDEEAGVADATVGDADAAEEAPTPPRRHDARTPPAACSAA
ncbi:MAG: hypothetical protein H6706_21245 [Myxococcales bacterium]|nr:hypothetical protein [Myxococcales bacterium]